MQLCVRAPIAPPSFEPFRTLPWPAPPAVEEESEEESDEEPVEDPEPVDWLTFLSVAVPDVPSTRRSGMRQWLNSGQGRREEDYLMLCQR